MCWAWNEVYGGQYLAPTRTEKDAWETRMHAAVPDWEDTWPLAEPWDTQLRRSWDLLFDPRLPPAPWGGELTERGDADREAVVGALHLAEVRGVTVFRRASDRLRRLRPRPARTRLTTDARGDEASPAENEP
jgi:hypothetical protein